MEINFNKNKIDDKAIKILLEKELGEAQQELESFEKQRKLHEELISRYEKSIGEVSEGKRADQLTSQDLSKIGTLRDEIDIQKEEAEKCRHKLIQLRLTIDTRQRKIDIVEKNIKNN